MILHENCLPADNSHDISCLIGYFWKSGKIWNCHVLQIIGGSLRVKTPLTNIFFVMPLDDFSHGHISCYYGNLVSWLVVIILYGLVGTPKQQYTGTLLLLFIENSSDYSMKNTTMQLPAKQKHSSWNQIWWYSCHVNINNLSYSDR